MVPCIGDINRSIWSNGDSPWLIEQTAVRMDLSHSSWSDIFFLAMDRPELATVINTSIDLAVRGPNGSGISEGTAPLPTEFDASFGRAMPVMKKHGVLYRSDAPHARRLLRAAAMTYVAASLMSLLNIARWWAILRR